jgi:microcystin-dependent protein
LATNAIHAANADNATHASDGVPPGTIMAFGGTVCPAGWVFCDGTIYDGANNNYSALYNVIGTIWGNGTIIGLGTTNATGGTKPFNVPDLRGMFLRGVDGTRGDLPDENNRVRIYAGSFSGNNIGTYESDQYASHSHTTSVSKDGSHQHNIALTRVSVSSGGSYGDTPVGLPDGNPTDAVTANDGAHTHTITIGNAGGAETRPRNMAVLYIIKL